MFAFYKVVAWCMHPACQAYGKGRAFVVERSRQWVPERNDKRVHGTWVPAGVRDGRAWLHPYQRVSNKAPHTIRHTPGHTLPLIAH